MQNLERIRQRKHEKLDSVLPYCRLSSSEKKGKADNCRSTWEKKQGSRTLTKVLLQFWDKVSSRAVLRMLITQRCATSKKTAAEETGNEITLKIVKMSAKWLIRPAIISGFSSMKRLGVFLLLPGYDASPSQVAFDINFPGTHDFVERGTVRVKCLAHEHNTMSQARARAARSRRSRAH